MNRSIAWYSQLLDLPVHDVAHEGMIYDLPTAGPTTVILDAYPKPVLPGGTGPRLMFTTTDIAQARHHALALSGEVTEIQDIGSSLVFYVEDPDGNLICIRQPKDDAPGEH